MSLYILQFFSIGCRRFGEWVLKGRDTSLLNFVAHNYPGGDHTPLGVGYNIPSRWVTKGP